MRKFLWTFCVLLFVTEAIGQEIKSPGYISLKEPYDFNLPQFGVGLKLPSGTGFIVPKYSGKNVALEISEKTYYYLDESFIEDGENNKFFFSPFNDYSDHIQMEIISYKDAVSESDFDMNLYKNTIKGTNRFIKEIEPISTNISQKYAYQFLYNEKSVESHVYYNDGYLYVFTLYADGKNRSAHERIIKSFGTRILKTERERYETRVKYGYYDKENKKITDYNTENPYRKITGKTISETEFDIPFKQLGITLPDNIYYEFNGRNLFADESGKFTLETDDLDLINNPMIFYWLRGKELSIMGRYSSKKNQRPVNFENMGEGGKVYYIYSKDVKMFIDGIEVYGLFTGSEENGELNLWFETHEGYHSFTLSGVNLKNIERYDELLKTIKINTEGKTGNKYTPLPLVLDFLKPKSMVLLDKIDIPKNLENAQTSFRCYFGKMDMDLWFPGKITDYKYGLNTTWGEEKLTADNNSVNNTVVPDGENFFVYLYSPRERAAYNISCTFYLTYGDNMPIKEMTEEYVRSYSSYTDAYPMRYEKAGIVTTTDGTELGVIIESEGKQAVILGKNRDYFFRYVITAPTPEKMMELSSIIYNFKM